MEATDVAVLHHNSRTDYLHRTHIYTARYNIYQNPQSICLKDHTVHVIFCVSLLDLNITVMRLFLLYFSSSFFILFVMSLRIQLLLGITFTTSNNAMTPIITVIHSSVQNVCKTACRDFVAMHKTLKPKNERTIAVE